MTALLDFVRHHRRALTIAGSLFAVYTLAGFFLLPWLIVRSASGYVQENYDADLRFGEVAVNPFVLSLRIDELALDDPDGEPLLSISQVFVNFQSSSLFRLAWTFDEIRIDSPQLSLGRDSDGILNAAFLAGTSDASPSPDPAEESDGGIPKLLIFSFAINDSVVEWEDFVPPEPVITRLGPVDVNIDQLNTLPSRSGEQSVVIATETQGTLSWSGSLQLNPVRSTGRASVKGSHFPLISAYLRHQVGFEIVEGDADLELAYDVGLAADGDLFARVDDLAIRFMGIRVRPFSADSNDVQPDVLSVPEFSLAGGNLRYPQRQVSFQSLDIMDMRLDVDRDADGMLNVMPPAGPPVAPESADADQPSGEPGLPWALSLERFLLDRAAVNFADASVTPAAVLGVEAMRLSVSNISNQPNAEFPVEFSTRTLGGGSISTDGRVVVLPETRANFAVNVEGLALALMQPYLQSVADISLDSGLLGVTGNVEHAPEQPVQFTGDVEVADLLVTETDAGARLGSWRRFAVEGIDFDLADRSLSVNRLSFVEPFVDVLIAEDGSINLGRAGKDETATVIDQDPTPDAQEPGARRFDVVIGGVEIETASAKFADLALPLPFETEIAELNGSLSTISTSSTEPASVDLEGKVDAYGRVRISGSVTPLDPPRNTDLDVVFENVEMPKMSAYTIPFAGREIAEGRLDLDLGYRIEGGSLEGENSIVLRDFELGERVPHPDAANLPLGLAVALLKDTDGNIDIDLPVRGDINDPEFSYGRVIRQALTNLIIRIAASPFALLGNLLGVEADELEYLSFDYGRSDLAPPERERITKLAEALALRPELALEIPPVADDVPDRAALQAAQLESIVDERLALLDDDAVAVQERRMTVLEAIYREENVSPDADADTALEQMRSEFTKPAPTATDAAGEGPSFDALAYAAALERRLAESQVLPNGTLRELASARAESVRQAIVEIDTALNARIVVVEPAESARGSEDTVRMRVALAADRGQSAPSPGEISN